MSPDDLDTLLRTSAGAGCRVGSEPDGGRFGCPAAGSALSAPDRRTAFTAKVDTLLDEAVRRRSPLRVPPDAIRTLVAEGGYALDEVTGPRLVHSALWPGDLFADVPDHGGPARITGLIDHERALRGDPAAEPVSLALVATPARTAASSPAAP
ncbi:hypothetical protein ACIF8T_25370 [Streptomyces sp. NPDC085946]|uniref:hypothetical protein n=1 Tax=Streptomyces sp. NPDC085946 TaxID=3365744 RepID=UPI0037CFDA9B